MARKRKKPGFGFNDAWQHLTDGDFDMAKNAGSSTARIPFDYAAYAGDSAFRDKLGQIIGAMRQRGIKPYLVPSSNSRPNQKEYNSVIRDLASQYRGQIKGIEILNEPNSHAYGNMSAKEYKQFFKSSRRAMNSVAPRMNAITAGLAPIDGWEQYMKKVARTKGDLILGAHIYPREGEGPMLKQHRQDLMSVLDAADRGKRKDRKVWVTETGISSGEVGEQRQARLMNRMIAQQARNGVGVITAHRLRDRPEFLPDNEWEQGLGVVRADGTVKPAYDALTRLLNSRRFGR